MTLLDRAKEYWERQGKAEFNKHHCITDLMSDFAKSQLPKWINCEDELPETPNPYPVQVLVCVRKFPQGGDIYTTAKFYKGEWFQDGGSPLEYSNPFNGTSLKVIKWMPLVIE